MTLSLLTLLALLWQSARGYAEGITMYQPGPRMHPRFGLYHAVRLVEIASLCGACRCLFDGCLTGHIADAGKLIGIAGLSILAWEAFELSYRLARRGQAAGYENILGLWSFDGPVWLLHTARATLGLTLTIGGWL